MKKKQNPQKSQEFKLVATAPASELRSSALFHHMQNMDLANLKSSNPNIKSIIAPNKDRRAYLIDLLVQKEDMNDLVLFMPDSLKNKYPKIKFYDHHIRIDENFGTLNSKVANQQLFSHWHYTARYNVDNEQSINVHVYFYYGIFLSAYVSDPDGNKTLTNMAFSARARENAKAACKFVEKVIADMKSKKEQLTQKFESLAAELNSKEYLSSVKREDLDINLCKLEEVDRLLGLYLQEEVSDLFIRNRFNSIKIRVLSLHDKTHVPLLAATTNMEEEEEELSTQYNRDTPVVGSKDKTLSLDENITARLNRVFDEFKSLQNKPSTLMVTDDYREYDSKLQGLRDELTIIFCSMHSENAHKHKNTLARFNVIENLINSLPTLLQIFETKVSKCDFYSATQVFKLVKFSVPSYFYMNFLHNNFLKNNNQQQDSSILELCKFFFQSSTEYRMLISLLKGLTNSIHYIDGPSVLMSPLAGLLMNKRFSFAKLLIEQSGCKDIIGVSFNNRCCHLLELLCMVGVNSESDAIIKFMLDSGAKIQNNFPFADGIIYKNELASSDKKTSKFADSSSVEKNAISSNKVSFYESGLNNIEDIPYIGSSLSAYCSSKFQSPEVLTRLAKMSDTIHLLIGAGSFNLLGINGSLLYTNKKSMMVVKRSSAEKSRSITKILNENSDQPITHIGYCWGSEDPRLHECVEILTAEINNRVSVLSSEKISELITMLHETMASHTVRGDNVNSLACQTAIISLCIYMESNQVSHRLILQTLYKRALSFKALAKQYKDRKLNPEALYTVSHDHFITAKKFVEISKFKKDLTGDSEYIDACNQVDNVANVSKSRTRSMGFNN